MDLVDRLRAFANRLDAEGVWIPGIQNSEAALLREAAEEIARLRMDEGTRMTAPQR